MQQRFPKKWTRVQIACAASLGQGSLQNTAKASAVPKTSTRRHALSFADWKSLPAGVDWNADAKLRHDRVQFCKDMLERLQSDEVRLQESWAISLVRRRTGKRITFVPCNFKTSNQIYCHVKIVVQKLRVTHALFALGLGESLGPKLPPLSNALHICQHALHWAVHSWGTKHKSFATIKHASNALQKIGKGISNSMCEVWLDATRLSMRLVLQNNGRFCGKVLLPTVRPLQHESSQNFAIDLGSSGVILEKEDFKCLHEGQVQDQIINAYLELLRRRCRTLGKCHFFFNTIFASKFRKNPDHPRLKRWTKRPEFRKASKIFVPVHFNRHWYLICIETSSGAAIVWDSIARKHSFRFETEMRNKIMDWLGFPSRKGFVFTAQCPKQTNGVDCGLFLMHFVRIQSVGGCMQDAASIQASRPRILRELQHQLLE